MCISSFFINRRSLDRTKRVWNGEGEEFVKIIVIGCGKVGNTLASHLSEENYDVVLIDQNEERLKAASDCMDLFCILGDGSDAEVQMAADVAHADLFIACTSTDEINMLSCLLAKKLGAKNTIARVRHPIYDKQMHLLREELRLSMSVNPEYVVAKEIARVLLFPDAGKVEPFVKGKVELIEVVIKEGNRMAGKSLAQINQYYEANVLICIVKRGKEVYIPDGDFVLQEKDKIYVAATHSHLEALFDAIGNRTEKIEKVMICGGGRVTYYLAHKLLQTKMRVKIIEKDRKKCEYLCEKLPKATIICADATDHQVLLEEGLEYADALVSLTGMDEENIILSLFAKTKKVSKVIAKVNEESRATMAEELGIIDSIVSAKAATAHLILSYVRARQKSMKSANIETMHRLVEDRVEVLEFFIRENCNYTNIPLKKLKIKSNNLIACIGRGEKILLPGGDDVIMQGDSVLLVTKDNKIHDLQDVLQ